MSASAQSNEAVRTLAQREKQPLPDTLTSLVEIESGSADTKGVTRIGTLIAERLRDLGGSVRASLKVSEPLPRHSRQKRFK